MFDKQGLEPIIHLLHQHQIKLYSTGGTQQFIEKLGVPVTAIESVTSYPSILDGRVKTLHPKVFGGILAIRENEKHAKEIATFDIPYFDLVIVDLYPFEKTIQETKDEAEIIEKIDIGGVSLIRAAAKNFTDCVIISNKNQYAFLQTLLEKNGNFTHLNDRKKFMISAFDETSTYDRIIHNHFKHIHSTPLRYGENPHQEASFVGDLDAVFDKIQGKELSYNNIVDIDSAVQLMQDLPPISVAIVKHTNACGIATRSTLEQAWIDALACDSISAFGGIIIANQSIDIATAERMNELFFEVLIAPAFEQRALEILQSKKNRILLIQKQFSFDKEMNKSALNGYLTQNKDLIHANKIEWKTVTNRTPTSAELEDLLYAEICAKHLKSNTIAIVKHKQMIGMGCGQTSRVDALQQALHKAEQFGFDVRGAVMASDAFFPFNDCVQMAHQAGITAVIQPGGSIKDKDSIDYCNSADMAMVTTGIRHFKH